MTAAGQKQSPEHIAKRAAAIKAAWEDPLKRVTMSRSKIGARKKVNLPYLLAELRSERVRRNMSQEDAAKIVGVCIKTICNCERNARRPTLDNLVAWGQAFGWRLTWEKIDDASNV